MNEAVAAVSGFLGIVIGYTLFLALIVGDAVMYLFPAAAALVLVVYLYLIKRLMR